MYYPHHENMPVFGKLMLVSRHTLVRVLRHSFRTKHVRHQTLKLKIVNVLRRKGLTVSDISHVVLFESEKLVSLFLCFFFVAVLPF